MMLRSVDDTVNELAEEGIIATDVCALCRQPPDKQVDAWAEFLGINVENDICPPCRDDLRERAESYGGDEAAIYLRYVEYCVKVRKGTYFTDR